MSRRQYLAVYGTLRKGATRHHLIEQEVEFIKNQRLRGVLRNVGDYPAYLGNDLIKLPGLKGYAEVVTEIYRIKYDVGTPTFETFYDKLDTIEGHPMLFERKHVFSMIPDPEAGPQPEDLDDDEEWGYIPVHATIYIGKLPSFETRPIVPGGDWVAFKNEGN